MGLDYIAGHAQAAGLDVEILDLGRLDDRQQAIREYFSRRSPRLVGLSFRNVDDCFWPSGEWFVPGLGELIDSVRQETDAPIVLGGVGYSILPESILEATGADFGVRGDGEEAIVALYRQLAGRRDFAKVPGLLWRHDSALRQNPPSWPRQLSLTIRRDQVDNPGYFKVGGQIGLETKRGCNRVCAYCADPLAKGKALRLRSPAEVADEAESLFEMGVDVLHLCDSEFNIPSDHARAVCAELERRHLGDRLRWYAYLAVVPFNAGLARSMRRAGCVGINFTSDSASPAMLQTYRQAHRPEDLTVAVWACREAGIRVMLDLLLGGPGESPATVRESVDFVKRIGPDCVGAALGVRLYPDTPLTARLVAEGPLEMDPAVRRHYEGPVDLLRPTFYVSSELGDRPAELVRQIIAGDRRFFEPELENGGAGGASARTGGRPSDHNYNRNEQLEEAILRGARGAYWDILAKLRAGESPA